MSEWRRWRKQRGMLSRIHRVHPDYRAMTMCGIAIPTKDRFRVTPRELLRPIEGQTCENCLYTHPNWREILKPPPEV